MTAEFLITTLIVVASPGTGVIYIVAAFGCTLGILPHLAAAMLGLAALLHASALAFNAVKVAGILYLLFMAWNSLRESGVLRVERVADRRSNLRVIVDGILINILNPKLSIFFVAFLPQFVSVDDMRPLLSMVELSSVFMLVTFAVFAIYGVFAAGMREHVVTRPRVMAWLRRSFAAAFAMLAARLAFAER